MGLQERVMDDTPRTDAAWDQFLKDGFTQPIWELARELERIAALAQKEAGFARLAYDQLSERYEQGIERAKGCVKG